MTNMDKSTKSISDHAFGRGYDIMGVGETKDSLKVLGDLVGKPEQWRNQFEIFLSKLSTLPVFLQPDSIVIGKVCYSQYVLPDDDPNRNKIKERLMNMFPGLGKHIHFGTDGPNESTHDNHIHISFGWSRAGNPDSLIQKPTSSEDLPQEIISGTAPTNISSETRQVYARIGTVSYEGNTAGVVKDTDMANLLVSTGLFNIEEIATIVGIMARESSLRPYVGNSSGAMGLMQIILNNNVGWEDEPLPVPYGNSSNKKNNTMIGYLLRNKNYTKASDSKTNSWNITTVDPLFWYPINQIAIMAYQMQVYYSQSGYKDAGARSSAESKRLWSNWGDGSWGRAGNQMPYGVLSSVSRDTVKKVYEHLGGDWAKYKTWGLVALVDEYTRNGKSYKRPADAAADAALLKDDGKTYAPAPYRNQWDFSLWYSGPNRILLGNKARQWYPRNLADVATIISSQG